MRLTEGGGGEAYAWTVSESRECKRLYIVFDEGLTVYKQKRWGSDS